MKINFIIPSPGNTGGLQVIYKYAEEFEKLGHDVIIYYPLKLYLLDHKKNIFWQISFTIYRTMINIFHFCICHDEMKYCNKVRQKYVPMIKNRFIRNADVVIATAWPTAFDVDKLNCKKGKKYYFIQDYEIWDDEKRGEESYKLPLQHIVIAKWICDTLNRNIGYRPRTIINNGIDVEKYSNDNKKINYNSPIHFLMLYHTLPKKGVKQGLDAYKQIQDRYPGVSLTLFGVKKGKDVPDDVEFIENPSQEEIRKLYCEADIYIYPSIVEGWGLTVIEAMAAKCAVVGTETGCLLDIGKNYENVLLSKPGDVEGMVENIEKLINDRALLERISLAGNNSIQELSWEKAVGKFIEILNTSQEN